MRARTTDDPEHKRLLEELEISLLAMRMVLEKQQGNITSEHMKYVDSLLDGPILDLLRYRDEKAAKKSPEEFLEMVEEFAELVSVSVTHTLYDPIP